MSIRPEVDGNKHLCYLCLFGHVWPWPSSRYWLYLETMSSLPNPERRQLDGPVRRPAVAPIAPVSAPPAPAKTEPALPRAVAPENEPVFEYRKPKKRHWVRHALIVAGIIVALTISWFGFKAVMAAHRIIGKAGSGAPVLAKTVDMAKLKGEGDGRVNILFLGVGGPGHDGANLSDTIMVMSLDPKTKDVAMLSIPRDLYVKIPATGKYQTQYSKINAANSYGGPDLAKKVIEGVIGVPIHYYIQADFSGFKQAVDAVGGVDVNVAKTLSDPKYPCDDGTKYANLYCPILFKPGPQRMAGAQALKYSRSRETTSDFDRAARQQQVLMALRQKSLEAATLTNPLKLTALLDAIGDHVKTDLQLEEIKKLASIAKDIDTTKITNKVLDTGKPDSLLIDGSGRIAGAGSIELPKAGNFDYSEIQDFVKNIFVDHYITDENTRIEVQNGSGITGLAGAVVTSLKSAHYNVLDATNADNLYPHTVIYDYTNGKKPYTINYLERRFGVKSQKASLPAATPTATPSAGNASAATVNPEIRIILGSDYKRASAQN